jgi:tetratricopeptide (TPR) repeat protein
MAVAYQYKKEYKNAIGCYERLIEIDENNPEIYYGIGQVYAIYLNDMEKGLDNMCKAYNLYIAQSSPYRTDAEKLINAIYGEMKKQGKEERFMEILKENNISPN